MTDSWFNWVLWVLYGSDMMIKHLVLHEWRVRLHHCCIQLAFWIHKLRGRVTSHGLQSFSSWVSFSNPLSQWLNFKLSGITCLVGKIKFKLLSEGPLAEWANILPRFLWDIGCEGNAKIPYLSPYLTMLGAGPLSGKKCLSGFSGTKVVGVVRFFFSEKNRRFRRYTVHLFGKSFGYSQPYTSKKRPDIFEGFVLLVNMFPWVCFFSLFVLRCTSSIREVCWSEKLKDLKASPKMLWMKHWGVLKYLN